MASNEETKMVVDEPEKNEQVEESNKEEETQETQETKQTEESQESSAAQNSSQNEEKDEEKATKGKRGKKEKAKTGTGEGEGEEATPRRSSRISNATAHAPPTPSNGVGAGGGTPGKAKRGAPKKRSADDLAGEEGVSEGKGGAKKMKTSEGEDEGLKIGEPLPEIKLKNEQGEEVEVKELAKEKKGVVFFLVPKADTPGCTTQACGFRDLSSDFTSLEFAVYCVSNDAPDKQKKWKDKKSLPFPLLSDPERSLIEKLTGNGKKTLRSHFVFTGGKLVDKRLPVKPVDSPRLALEFIRALETGNTAEPEAVQEADAADVAAASAAASAAVEPATAPAPATEQTTESKAEESGKADGAAPVAPATEPAAATTAA